MKKIICILVSLLILGTASFAQKNNTKKTEPKAANQEPAKTTDAKPAKKLKKDGTPDMRHKENKADAKPAPKLKKDGTPDMRYKDNKKAPEKKK